MTVPVLSNADARRLFLHKHGLCERPADLQAVFAQLGFVQLDSINTVARAHHMIIHARLQTYRPPQLDRLRAQRAVFEHWTHDASIIHMAHYPFWKLRFRRTAETLQARWESYGREGIGTLTEPMLERLGKEAPLCSADVGEGEKRSSGGWWEWHPSKTALEYLWQTGQIAVCHRRGFRKYYDLAERVIPADLRAEDLSDAEIIDWCCASALDRLGFATSGELAAFYDHISAAEARGWAQSALADGSAIEVDIECADGKLRRSLARPDVMDQTANAPNAPGMVRILSPFDPALRDRARSERLFGFNYRIEIFVPAAKRVYGYYVFPVLEGDRLIGRIDMKAEKSVLTVRRFWPEAGVRMGEGRVARLRSAVARTARLAGADQIIWPDDWCAA